MERKHRGMAALTLVVWAPMAGELLTSSAPPLVFFIPWVFLLFACLYGLGALLIRETAIRFKMGWPAILLCGAAYGIFEEGLGAKSFFDPNWRAIGPLGEHGRAMGVNWVWSIGLTGFHAFYSIALSVLAVETLFPKVKKQPWLGQWGIAVATVLFGLTGLLFYQKGNEQFFNSGSQSLACILLIALLVLAAFFLPVEHARAPETQVGWNNAFLFCFVVTGIFIFLLYFLPELGITAWFTAGLLIALFLAIAFMVGRWTSGGQYTLSRKTSFGVLAGVYSCFAIQAPLQEFNPGRPDSATGMSVVGVCVIAGLFIVGQKILRRSSASEFMEKIDGY